MSTENDCGSNDAKPEGHGQHREHSQQGKQGEHGQHEVDRDCFDCREVFLRIDDYIDRTLSTDEIEQVNAHLDECSPCAKELGFTTSMIEQIRAKLTRVQAPEQLKARLAELLSAGG